MTDNKDGDDYFKGSVNTTGWGFLINYALETKRLLEDVNNVVKKLNKQHNQEAKKTLAAVDKWHGDIEIYTSAEVEKILKIKKRTLQKYRTLNLIKYAKKGKNCTYRKEDIVAFLQINYTGNIESETDQKNATGDKDKNAL